MSPGIVKVLICFSVFLIFYLYFENTPKEFYHICWPLTIQSANMSQVFQSAWRTGLQRINVIQEYAKIILPYIYGEYAERHKTEPTVSRQIFDQNLKQFRSYIIFLYIIKLAKKSHATVPLNIIGEANIATNQEKKFSE